MSVFDRFRATTTQRKLSNSWFQNKTTREKKLLIITSLVVLISAIIFFINWPLYKRISKINQQMINKQQDVAKMRALGQQIQSIPIGANNEQKFCDINSIRGFLPPDMLQSTATLVAQEGGVQLRVARTAYAPVASALKIISEQTSCQVQQASIEFVGLPDITNVQITWLNR